MIFSSPRRPGARWNVLSLACLVGVGCAQDHLRAEDDGSVGPSTDAASALDGGVPGFDAGGRVGEAGVPIPRDAGTVVVEPDAGGPLPEFDSGIVVIEPDSGTVAVDPDAGIVVVDGGTVIEPDAGGGGVTCGMETCAAPQVCCVRFGGGGSSQSCALPTDCRGVALACDGPEDCGAGEACCASRTSTGGGAQCVASTMCRFGRLCHIETDCDGDNLCCPFMGASVCAPRCF